MKVFRYNDSPDAPALVAGTASVPKPKAGELLIRVHAAGVTPTELQWSPTTRALDGSVRTGAIPGHEFSGVVEAGDPGWIGREIFGFNDWFADGATAEYCLTVPANIAEKPARLSHAEAASVPIGALTAWQGLIDRAKLQPGERILCHGGSGAVGVFAIQLARRIGAHVITTASARNFDFLTQLGAAECIDYHTDRFEEKVGNVDVIFDAVGGETLKRSWDLLKPGGRLVTIAADSEGTNDKRIEKAFFIVETNSKQLADVAALIDQGELQAVVDAIVPLENAAEAYGGKIRNRKGRGKVVLTVAPGDI